MRVILLSSVYGFFFYVYRIGQPPIVDLAVGPPKVAQLLRDNYGRH